MGRQGQIVSTIIVQAFNFTNCRIPKRWTICRTDEMRNWRKKRRLEEKRFFYRHHRRLTMCSNIKQSHSLTEKKCNHHLKVLMGSYDRLSPYINYNWHSVTVIGIAIVYIVGIHFLSCYVPLFLFLIFFLSPSPLPKLYAYKGWSSEWLVLKGSIKCVQI